MRDGNGPPRIRVDLRRLPVWQQYAIALAVTGVVVAFAWQVGHTRVTPHWITAWLVPALGWIGLFLIVTGVIARVLRK